MYPYFFVQCSRRIYKAINYNVFQLHISSTVVYTTNILFVVFATCVKGKLICCKKVHKIKVKMLNVYSNLLFDIDLILF